MPEPCYGDANRRLWRIMGTRWPKELWAATGQNSILLQTTMRKCPWIVTLRKGDGSIQKQALDWNLQTARRGGRPKQTWKRIVLRAAEKCGITWWEVKRVAGNRQLDGDDSQMACFKWKGWTHCKHYCGWCGVYCSVSLNIQCFIIILF